MNAPLLALHEVSRHYHTQAGVVRALDRVSLDIAPGETLGLVGESGCGKSTVARVAMRLTDVDEGAVRLDGKDIASAHGRALQAVRPRVQMVFQDPAASLNPRATIGQTLEAPLIVHRRGNVADRQSRIADMLRSVGLHPDMASRHSHELSGGQRQRVAIARALMLNPALLVCDEAVSALDVSVRAQVLNLLLDLRETLGIAYLFISHDLAVVRHMSDRIAVMYLGQVVELGPCDAVWHHTLHPYTRALMAAAPSAHPANRRLSRIGMDGEVPSPFEPPSGCRFHTRCPQATELCRSSEPALRPHGTDHWVRCHLA